MARSKAKAKARAKRVRAAKANNVRRHTAEANGADVGSKNRSNGVSDGAGSLLPVLFSSENLAIDPDLEPIAESVRFILARPEFGGGALPRRIGVVAALPGEGVSTISSMFSSVLSSDFGVQTCRVDLSWGSSEKQGVFDVAMGAADLDDVLEWEGHTATLHSGAVARSDRHRLARSEELDTLINDLSNRFHHVVFDMPSILRDSEGLAMMRFVDSYLLVVKHGVTTLQQVQTATEQLGDTAVLGSVINHVRTRTPRLLSRWLEG